MPQFVLGSYFEMFDIRGAHFGVLDSQRHFPYYFSSFLSVLALGPTVILRVYSCLDLGLCRIISSFASRKDRRKKIY